LNAGKQGYRLIALHQSNIVKSLNGLEAENENNHSKNGKIAGCCFAA